MKTKILSKSLSLALSLVILVSMFSICLFSASALDAEFLLDDETNGFANWNNSLNVDGTLKDGMVKKFLTVNEEKWPSGKIIDTASLGFTATTVQGANSNSISFVYYYENENNYKIFSARETAAGLLYVSLSDMVEGELSTPTEITSDQSKILSSSLGARSAGVYLGMNAGVTCVISYLDKDNVNITLYNKDKTESYSVNVSDSTADDKDIDFKAAETQKFGFIVNALNNTFQCEIDSINIVFEKMVTITGSSIVDSASNEFEHFDSYVEADGSVRTKDNIFTTNDGLWPAGKKLKSVELDVSADIAGATGKYMMLAYYVTDSQNYKALALRETTNKELLLGFVDVIEGVKTTPTNMSATNSIPMNTAASKNTKTIVGFSNGANVKVEYLDSSNIKFTFTSADATATFTTTLTANDEANVDFKSTSNKFAVLFTSSVTSPKFSRIAIDWEKGASEDIAAFKEKYASVLVDILDLELLATVKSAIAEYETLSEEVKAGLTVEYEQLNKNYCALIIESGIYSTNFESGLDGWEQFADFTDKNGSPVVQSNFDVVALGDRTGGISQNESGNILAGKTSVTTDTYTQADNSVSGYEEYTKTQLINENTYAINATMMIAPSRSLWDAIKKSNKDFASAEFDTYVNLSGSTSGAFIYYNYKDNNNFSYFKLIRSAAGGLNIANVVVTSSENGLISREINHLSDSTKKFNNWTVSPKNWVHVRLSYTEDNKAIIIVTGEPGDFTEVISEDVVAKENRMVAFGSSLYQSTTVEAAIDNFSMVIAGAETQEGINFEIKFRDTFKLSADRFAPYDAREIDEMLDAFNELTQTAKDSLSEETLAKVNALKAARNAWDITGDESIAASYKAVWGAKLETETEKAWNVYNRLTAVQKALLETEYDVMVAAMQSKTQVTDDTVNINCVGDSITFGSGSTSVADYSYPSQMQALLGDGYTVSRNGIAGIKVVDDYTVTSVDDVKLGMDGSQQWIDSHKGTDDIIIIQLGTNDLSHVAGKDEIKTEIYKAGFEKMIQSYLRLENSPLVVISNTPVSYSAADSGYAYKTIALLNMAMAEKYGLPCIDMQAYTEAYTDEEIASYYSADRLHFTNEGYTKMANVFYNAIKSLDTTFDTANVTAYSFDENEINSFLAPEMLAATIKKATTSAGQDLGFITKISNVVKTGATIVEYGTIFSKYKSDNEETILNRMVYSETADPNKLVAYARGFSSDVVGMEYIAGLGGANNEQVKEAYIARSYVKFSDGSIYYSINDYNDAASYSNRKGVVNGYACRSVVSIAKEMVKFLAVNGIENSDIASYNASTDTLTFTETAKANYDLIFGFLTAHKNDIYELVEGGN